MPFYAVKRGKTPGIYITWKEAEAQIKGYTNPIFKKFESMELAQAFMTKRVDEHIAERKQDKEKSDAIHAEINEKLKELTITSYDEYSKPGLTTQKHPDTWTKHLGKYYLFTDGSRMIAAKDAMIDTPVSERVAHVGYGVYFGEKSVNISNPMPLDTTNNMCELLAISRALETVNKFSYALADAKIVIVSDSEYAVKSITEWMPKWKANGWKLSDGSPVKNLEIIQQLDTLITSIAKLPNLIHPILLTFKHQNSHLSTKQIKTKADKILWEGNYIVDYLAKQSGLSTTN
jgi:ribonuclease HI